MDSIDAARASPGGGGTFERFAGRQRRRCRALDGPEDGAEHVVQVAEYLLRLAFALLGRQRACIALRGVPKVMRDSRVLPPKEGTDEQETAEETQRGRHAAAVK